MNLFDLAGKRALVTGAAGRLGPIWADALRAARAQVWRSDMNGDERAQPPMYGLDVTNVENIEAAWVDCGPIDIWVNNAGVDDRPTKIRRTGVQLDALGVRMAHVNLGGTYLCTRLIGQRMVERQQGGVIINIASLYGLIAPDLALYSHLPGFEKHAMYGATKAGIISLTQYYAAKFAPHGVRVNAIAPGGVINPGDPLTGSDPEFVRKYSAKIPMGQMCQAEDLAGPLVFLASEASRFMTGQTLVLDGGFTCH